MINLIILLFILLIQTKIKYTETV